MDEEDTKEVGCQTNSSYQSLFRGFMCYGRIALSLAIIWTVASCATAGLPATTGLAFTPKHVVVSVAQGSVLLQVKGQYTRRQEASTEVASDRKVDVSVPAGLMTVDTTVTLAGSQKFEYDLGPSEVLNFTATVVGNGEAVVVVASGSFGPREYTVPSGGLGALFSAGN